MLQPARLRDAGWAERLAAYGADLAVVVAFGQILPKAVLDAPARGSINIHGSLLPKYRGAAPIQWAIIRGETETGITTFQMDPGMDTGDMLLRRSTPIGPEETAGELSERLARLGADVIVDTLDHLDTLTPTPQNHAEATMAPRLTKANGVIDWTKRAVEIVNVVRGCNPWPGATTTAPGGALTIWRARALPEIPGGAPGTLASQTSQEGAPAIAAGDGLLLPVEVQPENRRAMPWADYLRGARLAVGARFGSW